MSAAEAVAKLLAGDVPVIDVREAGEIAASGKAKGARLIPLSLLPLKADPRQPDCAKRLPPGKPVAVYCASGARSASAMQVLNRLGYDQVHNLGGASGLGGGGRRARRCRFDLRSASIHATGLQGMKRDAQRENSARTAPGQ